VKREHVTKDIPLCETRCSVGEEVPPFPPERLERGGIFEFRVSLYHRVHRHVCLESAIPFSQRPRVMRTVILDELDRESVLGCFGCGVDQSWGTRERGVGPHVAAREVLLLVSRVTIFWPRRTSNDSGGVLVLQSPVDKLEESLMVSRPHVLKVAKRMDQLGRRREGRER